jgi:putative ATP-binding cassette transporter
VTILWALSADAPLRLFGQEWAIPGYLVWAALIYAVAGTCFTHLIGWPLIKLNFNQQRYEADFRFNLVRVRENGEQIALLSGEAAERARLLGRFASVVDNWLAIMTRQKKLTFFTAGYSQISSVFPILVVSPAYFANHMQLGGLMQTASAFGRVENALSFFVNTYRQIAEWSAVIERLAGFEKAVALGRAAAVTQPAVTVEARKGAGSVEIEGLDVHLPAGAPLVTAARLTIAPGARVLVNGPSGSGKSTLFRAIAGIWPFGSGKIVVPEGARVMLLPQRPYLPLGTLIAAVTYPSLPGRFEPGQVRDMLRAVGLPALAERLDEEAHWNRMLSLGEQQRVGLARAILHRPDYLFLDEATASLDEPAEANLYKLLQERLPGTAVISIGHRSTLAAFHRQLFTLEPEGGRFSVRERALAASPGAQ